MAFVKVLSHLSAAVQSLNACSDWMPSWSGLAIRAKSLRSAGSLTISLPSGSTTASVQSSATLRTSPGFTSVPRSGAPG